MLIVKTDVPVIDSSEKIVNKIAHFWNQISEGWHEIMGPHIHHGFYETEASTIRPFAISPEERLIEKLCQIAEVKPGQKILDVGCGMGGTSYYLANHYKTEVLGISLSQKQIEIAKAKGGGKTSNVAFKIEDAHALKSLPDNSFDLVWSLESCEQFYDKPLFIEQAYRVLKPKGKLMIATWCSARNEFSGKQAKNYLKLCEVFDLPYMPTIEYYLHQLNHRFGNGVAHDWTRQVKPSWKIGIHKLRNFSWMKIFKLGGVLGLRFIRHLSLMRQAFENEQLRYGVFIATKFI